MDSLLRKVREIIARISKITGPKNLNLLSNRAKDPLFCLGIISIILFGLTSLGSGVMLESLSNQGDFSFLLASKALDGTFGQDLFVGPIKKFSPESPDFILIQESSLVGISPPVMVTPQVLGALIGDEPSPENREEIIEYLVEEGDNLSSIAERFEISIDTLISANNLKNQLIRPGQKLLILPVSGVMHIVKEGESILGLAEKYKVETEEIIAFNRLSEGGRIFIDQRLIIPGGKMPLTRPAIPRANVGASTNTSNFRRFSTNNFYGQSHNFPFGQCTWWVAQKRAIPAWGHAKSWLSNAEADGYQICRGRYCIPQQGAVIVVRGNPVFGHVGYVERTQGNQVTFSEMNTIGLGKMNYRTLTIGDPSIIGYIY